MFSNGTTTNGIDTRGMSKRDLAAMVAQLSDQVATFEEDAKTQRGLAAKFQNACATSEGRVKHLGKGLAGLYCPAETAVHNHDIWTSTTTVGEICTIVVDNTPEKQTVTLEAVQHAKTIGKLTLQMDKTDTVPLDPEQMRQAQLWFMSAKLGEPVSRSIDIKRANQLATMMEQKTSDVPATQPSANGQLSTAIVRQS